MWEPPERLWRFAPGPLWAMRTLPALPRVQPLRLALAARLPVLPAGVARLKGKGERMPSWRMVKHALSNQRGSRWR